MLGLDAGALPVDFVPRVGEVELDEFDVAAGNHVDAALAALFQLEQDLVFDLQVPRIVEFAGLQHCARGRNGVAAPLHLDGVEERAVRLVIIRVERAADNIARCEVDELVGSGTHRLQVVRRVARLGTLVRLEQMLGDQHAVDADKRQRPERRGLGELHAHRILVDGGSLHILVRPDGHRRRRRVGRVFPVEHDVGGGEQLAVVPLHVSFQFPDDRLAVPGYATVLDSWNFSRETGNQVAVIVPAGERFVENARAILILGAGREVRIQQCRALPPQHLERAAAAALRAFVGRCGLRLRDARVHQQLPRDRRRNAESQQGADEFPARNFSLAYRFDQTPQFPFCHG